MVAAQVDDQLLGAAELDQGGVDLVLDALEPSGDPEVSRT